tara:strand:+ start:1429 stop:1815 length:387 start_codon:yes stop_codon:yes gene_type:complete
MTNRINEKRVRGIRNSTRTIAFCAIPHGSGEQPYAVVIRHVPNNSDRPYAVYDFHMESGAFGNSWYCNTLEIAYQRFAQRVANYGEMYADRVDDDQKWVAIRHSEGMGHPFVNLNDELRDDVEYDHDA